MVRTLVQSLLPRWNPVTWLHITQARVRHNTLNPSCTRQLQTLPTESSSPLRHLHWKHGRSLLATKFCRYRFAWTSLGSQPARVTAITLFCSPCLRALRWGLSQWIPYLINLTVLPRSWCLCSCREAPPLLLLDRTLFWSKNNFYSALHCELNNYSLIKLL